MKKILYPTFLFVLVGILCCMIVCRFLYFPLKYKDYIVEYSQEYNVDCGLVASVIRVESGYDPTKVSAKNAQGLMQLLPTTALDMAERLDIDEYDIFEPKDNIQLGTYYLSYLLSIFEDRDTALASYNAGLGNVKGWLQDIRYSIDGVTLKYIPFDETREYVDKVNKFYDYYKLQF